MSIPILMIVAAISSTPSASALDQKSMPCPAGQHRVRAYHRRAYIRADGSHVSGANVRAHCQANPPSFQRWDTLVKNQKLSLKAWPYPNEKQRVWTEEERERLLEALSDVPEQLWMNTIGGIFRFERSSIYSRNPAEIRDGIIVLYDEAFDRNAKLARILTHELAHEYYRQMSDERTWEYVGAADWRPTRDRKTGRLIFIPGRLEYVEEDGPESLDEDFSNNIEYYLFEPDKLQR